MGPASGDKVVDTQVGGFLIVKLEGYRRVEGDPGDVNATMAVSISRAERRSADSGYLPGALVVNAE
jgi:hypothetical protein